MTLIDSLVRHYLNNVDEPCQDLGRGLRAVEEILKPPGSLLATDRSKAVVLV